MDDGMHGGELLDLRDVLGRNRGGVTSVEADGDFLVLRLRIAGDDRHFGVRLAAPWSDMLQPWLYSPPEDTRDWANQLRTWLDEELHTGAVHEATLTERDGVHWFAAEPYGLRRRNQAEHERLLTRAPLGWHGPYRTPGGDRRWLGDPPWPEPDSGALREIEELEEELERARSGTSDAVGTVAQHTARAIGWLALLAMAVVISVLNVSQLLSGDFDEWDVAQLIAGVVLLALVLPRTAAVTRSLAFRVNPRRRRAQDDRR